MKLSFGERDFISALSLYLATKRTALRSALQFRAPLSADAAEDLRIHYSNYFVALMSAADLIIERPAVEGERFRQALEAAFSALGGLNAATNYSYVRELRNAIVHRGLDIAWAAQVSDDFPLLVAPAPIENRSGTQKYSPYGFYLLEIVAGCETVVGPTIEAHLNYLGILNKEPDVAALVEEEKRLIQSSTVMPDWAKRMASFPFTSEDWNALHCDRIKKLRDLLGPQIFSVPSAAHAAGVR